MQREETQSHVCLQIEDYLSSPKQSYVFRSISRGRLDEGFQAGPVNGRLAAHSENDDLVLQVLVLLNEEKDTHRPHLGPPVEMLE